MKRKLWFSFLFVILMLFVMRWQGTSLVTAASPRGIIDLEFARTPERLRHLLLFISPSKVQLNIFLDFIFIIAYTWFLVAACRYIRSKTSWNKASGAFISLAITAAMFDVVENFLLLLIIQQRFDASLLEVVYYSAAIKFILVGAVILYLLF